MHLALSSASTILSGGITRLFQLALWLEIPCVELYPYRWTTIERLRNLRDKFSIQVCGVHERFSWNRGPLAVARTEFEAREWPYAFLWWALLGQGNSGQVYRAVENLRCPSEHGPLPYWLLHPDTIQEMGDLNFHRLRRQLTVVIENERPKKPKNRSLYNPYDIAETYRPLGCWLALDPRHLQIANRTIHTSFDPLQIFLDLKPEILHFDPKVGTVAEWQRALERHQPHYLVLQLRQSGLGEEISELRDAFAPVLR